MRLERLRVRNYRGIASFEFRPAPCGVTVLEGRNEAGKSSLIEALRYLLNPAYKDRTRDAKILATRPVGQDVGTEIEADLNIGGKRVQFRRRFHRERMTELQVEGERPLAGDDAHEAFHALLQRHVDQVLWDALWIAQSGGLTQASLANSRFLRDALDAAGERVSAGDETIRQRIEKEYRRFFTNTGRETGELAAAQKEARRWQDEADDLRRQLGRLEQRMNEAAALDEQAHRLAREAQNAAHAREDAERRFEELREVEAARERAGGEARAAAERVRGARTRLQAIRDHAALIENNRRDIERFEHDLEVAADNLAALTRDHQAAAAAANIARDNLKKAGDAHLLALNDRSHLDNALQLEQMKGRYERAGHDINGLAAARGRLASIRISTGTLERLRQLERAVERARGTHDAAATHVELTAQADFAMRVGDVARSFRKGERVRLDIEEATALELPGLLRIDLQPAAQASAMRAALEEARSRFAEALAEAGVDDIAAAEALDDERRALERQVHELPARISAELQDLTHEQLREKIATQSDRVAAYRAGRRADPPMPRELHAARMEEAARKRDLDAATENARTAEAAENTARARLEDARRDFDRKQALLGDARRRADDFATRQANDEDPAAVEEELAVAVAEANNAETRRAGAEERLRALGGRAAREALLRSRELAASLERDLASARERLAGARGEILAGQEISARLDRAEAELAPALARLERVAREARAARALRDAVEEARSAAQARVSEPFRQLLVRLGRNLYGESFDVTLSGDLAIRTRTLHGVEVDFEALSGGAQEQLAILSRLAAAMLVEPGEGVPLVIDDALGYTDPERLSAIGEVLGAESRQCQVIVLTCQPGRFAAVPGAARVTMP